MSVQKVHAAIGFEIQFHYKHNVTQTILTSRAQPHLLGCFETLKMLLRPITIKRINLKRKIIYADVRDDFSSVIPKDLT